MILDQLSNASLYQFANPRISLGLKFLQSAEIANLPLGRTDIDGDHLFALVQQYTSRPESECLWEAHRKFIDIQFLAAGRERIDYSPLSDLEITSPYDATKDRVELIGAGTPLILQPGMFTIFFPTDAHRPCVASGTSAPVRKIVLKVEV